MMNPVLLLLAVAVGLAVYPALLLVLPPSWIGLFSTAIIVGCAIALLAVRAS